MSSKDKFSNKRNIQSQNQRSGDFGKVKSSEDSTKSNHSSAFNNKKTAKPKANAGAKVRLQEYLDSLIELHKLQAVLLNQMDKEI